MIELIIIDGKVKNCEVLFECNSVDDLASFKMIREGVEVTPDNAPTFDIFDIKLIAEPRSPYGFSSLFKRNPNIDEWEYMGFGHSGACSVVTALLKQLQRKEQECEELKKKKEENETFYLREYANKDSECLELQHKLRIATEALDIIANQNFNTPNKICNLAEKELVPCTNNCKYCLQAYAQRALEQIESEEQ